MRVQEQLSRHKQSITFATLVAVSLFSLVFSTDSLSVRPEQIGQSFLGVFQQAGSAIGSFFGRTITSVRELAELQRQHADLIDQLRAYEAVADEVELLRAENERLRDALAFSESLSYENIPARVIGKEPGSFFAGFSINRGRTAGIERNMAVIASWDGMQGLVGRIAEVGLTTSVVMPVFDANSFVAARLLRTRHEGIVSGDGVAQGSLTMRYVPKGAQSELRVGDVVVTSGMSSIFPESIRVGTVEAVHARTYETSLSIELRPAVDYSRVEYVFVVKERM